MSRQTAKEKDTANGLELGLIGILIIFSISLGLLYFSKEILIVLTKEGTLKTSVTFIVKSLSNFHAKTNFFNINGAYGVIIILNILLSLFTKPKLQVDKGIKRANIILLVSILFLALSYLCLKSGFTMWLFGLYLFSIFFYMLLFNNAAGIFVSYVTPMTTDIFNDENEQFPQNKELVLTENSVNYNTIFEYNNEWNQGYINVINPQRAVLISGVPGSGKTFTLLNPAIWQSIQKGHAAMVYDYKFPDLANLTYNALIHSLEENEGTYGIDAKGIPIVPKFVIFNFDDPSYTTRCNPFAIEYLKKIDDAYNVSKTLLQNLNKTWAKKEGEFFEESAINYLTLCVWYLRIIEKEYNMDDVCSIPHAIELALQPSKITIELFKKYRELDGYNSIFNTALEAGANDQLAGQIGSLQNAVARLSSPTIYWGLTSNDEQLILNDKTNPKIIIVANNPQKDKILGAPIAALISTILKSAYIKDNIKSGVFLDELATVNIDSLDTFIATIRSYNVSTWLGVQDYEQLVRDYGIEKAKVVINSCGTIMSGLVQFETAEKLSKMFGKTLQDNQSTSFGEDMTFSQNDRVLELLPASKISSLSQGNFVGRVADTFQNPNKLKLFSAYVAAENYPNQHTIEDLRIEVTEQNLLDNFLSVKADIQSIIVKASM
jgi:hypothetical protein